MHEFKNTSGFQDFFSLSDCANVMFSSTHLFVCLTFPSCLSSFLTGVFLPFIFDKEPLMRPKLWFKMLGVEENDNSLPNPSPSETWWWQLHAETRWMELDSCNTRRETVEDVICTVLHKLVLLYKVPIKCIKVFGLEHEPTVKYDLYLWIETEIFLLTRVKLFISPDFSIINGVMNEESGVGVNALGG